MKVQLKTDIYPPIRSSEGSAGLDIRTPRTLDLYPGEEVSVHTGIRVAIPKFYFGLLVPRSGLGRRGLMLTNTVGIIDSDYRGEIIVSVRNMSNVPLIIAEGDRFCQLIICHYLHIDPKIVDDLDDTDRGDGGFGSTGS